MDELLDTLSARELGEWMAFYVVEPWGSETDFMRSGIVASTIANTARDPKKRRAFTPADFMPKFGKPRKTPEKLKAELMAFVAGAKRGA